MMKIDDASSKLTQMYHSSGLDDHAIRDYSCIVEGGENGKDFFQKSNVWLKYQTVLLFLVNIEL